MKKILLFTLLAAVGLTGCETYHETYHGIRGEYGFTYDLHNTPSPFVDTSYRPLTPFDLAAPMIVVVTNQPPPRIVYQESPQIGETRYAGESPARAPIAGAAAPTIVESAGAQPGQAGQAATAPGTAGAAAPTAAQPFYGTGGDVFIAPGTNVVQTNTNVMATNIISTNTNVFGMVTNTNVMGGVTNTNVATGTNTAINEPAGTALQTNRPFGEPPGTQFRTNRFGEPPVPPKAATNRVLFIPQNTTPAPQTQTPGTGVPQQPLAAPQVTPQQSPVQQQQQQQLQQQQQQQRQQRIQTGPPASAPQSPPAPVPPSSSGAPNSSSGGAATPPSGPPSSP